MIALATFVDTAIREIIISAEREDSHKAFYMAEAGINCVTHHHRSRNFAFSMRSPEQTYFCGQKIIYSGSGGHIDETIDFTFKAGWQDKKEDYDLTDENRDECYYDAEASSADLLLPIAGIGLEQEDYFTDQDLQDHFLAQPEPLIIRSQDSEACARVSVEVLPRPQFDSDGDRTVVYCQIQAVSRGFNKCDEDGQPVEGSVERTRIMGLD